MGPWPGAPRPGRHGLPPRSAGGAAGQDARCHPGALHALSGAVSARRRGSRLRRAVPGRRNRRAAAWPAVAPAGAGDLGGAVRPRSSASAGRQERRVRLRGRGQRKCRRGAARRADRRGEERRGADGRLLSTRGAHQLRRAVRGGVGRRQSTTAPGLTARYHDSVSVFVGSFGALITVAALAIIGGRVLLRVVPLRLVRMMAGGWFGGPAVLTAAAAIRA